MQEGTEDFQSRVQSWAEASAAGIMLMPGTDAGGRRAVSRLRTPEGYIL